jgi:hypothetical protein
VWTAQDIPGGIVKHTVTKKKGAQVSSRSAVELVEFVVKPAAKAPAKK